MNIALHIFSPFLALAVNIVFQIMLFRSPVKCGLLKSVLWGLALGMGLLLIIEIYYMQKIVFFHYNDVASILANMIIYVSLGYTYFHFINMGETARRIRILRELYESKDGLTAAEICQRYQAREVIEKRIDRLVDNRQIIERDGKYYIGSRIALFAAQVTKRMKQFLLRKESEFD